MDKVPLMLTPGMDLIKEGANIDNHENNFPHHTTLVCNSLISCLDDSSQFVKRAALDFMYSHLRLKCDVIG